MPIGKLTIDLEANWHKIKLLMSLDKINYNDNSTSQYSKSSPKSNQIKR